MSGKIRRLLEEHLDVTGLRTVVRLRHITDPDFWIDFDTDRPARELRRATIRKATELKRITYEKVEENPLRYRTFSERVLEVIRRFEEGQLAAAEALGEFEEIARDLEEEGRAHESSGLNERAYGIVARRAGTGRSSSRRSCGRRSATWRTGPDSGRARCARWPGGWRTTRSGTT